MAKVFRIMLGCAVMALPITAAATAGGAANAAAPAPIVQQAPSKVPALLRAEAAEIAAVIASNGTPSLSAAQVSELASGVLMIDTAGAIGVQVHAAAPTTSSQRSDLSGLGVQVLGSSSDWAAVPGASLPTTGLVSAMVPYDALDAVAALPWVTVLRPSFRPALDVGPIEAESVPLHKADEAQDNGFTGRGQKVGAISGDVDHIADSIAQGELPRDVQVLKQANYDDDEGTAMLEIVHDMAPKADLAYASTGHSLYDYIGAFHRLAANGATLITEDIAFDDEPAFQQGLGASTAEALAKYGIWVSSSAGNLGTRHAPRVRAVGQGRGPDGADGRFHGCPDDPDNLVDLRGSDNTYDLTLGIDAQFSATLQWSEPRAIYPTEGQGGFTDLNLYLVDSTGTRCLDSSANVQANGVGDTIEEFVYKNRTGATQTVKLVVDVRSKSTAVSAPLLDLRWRAYTAGVGAVDPSERAGSLNPDSNYLGYATSAAAVNASASTDPETIALETYSAAGPVQIVSTTQCKSGHMGPCTGVPGRAMRTWVAPTWAAADGVSVSGAGGFGSGTCPTDQQGACRFYGTSAAAPSAAGVATLVREEFGGRIKPTKLNSILSARAVHRSGPGFGAGVLSAT